jgi:hypothetical protein
MLPKLIYVELKTVDIANCPNLNYLYVPTYI